MNRSIRVLLIVGAFAVVGMLVLSGMLSRYNRLAKQAVSLDEFELSVAEPLPPLEPTEFAEPPADSPAAPRSAAEIEVEQFVEIRQEIKALIAAQKENPARWVDSTTGTFADDLQQYAIVELQQLMVKVRMRRLAACAQRGIDEADYLRTRDAFRGWRDGATIDAELVVAFDARADQLEAFDLGMLEELDG